MKRLYSTQKPLFIGAIVWLLQHEFILQLHRYVHLILPLEAENEPRRSLDACDDTNQQRKTTASSEELVVDEDGLTFEEKEYLEKISVKDSNFAMLKRLCAHRG